MTGLFKAVALALALVAGSVGAAPSELPKSSSEDNQPIHVVKVMNFRCPVCRTFEGIDSKIAEAVTANGGKFLRAPLSVDGQPDAKDRVYYASRGYGKRVEDTIVQALYKGSQEFGQMFEDVAQVVVWLQHEHYSLIPDWNALAEKASSTDTDQSVRRALHLAAKSGVDSIPAYLLVKGGNTLHVFDPSNPDTARPSALQAALLRKLTELSGQ